MRTYYKVIIIMVGTFDSRITDERHFSTRLEAERYADTVGDNKIGVVVKMN